MMTDLKHAEKANANLQKDLSVRMPASPFRIEDTLCGQFYRLVSLLEKWCCTEDTKLFLGLKPQSRDK